MQVKIERKTLRQADAEAEGKTKNRNIPRGIQDQGEQQPGCT